MLSRTLVFNLKLKFNIFWLKFNFLWLNFILNGIRIAPSCKLKADLNLSKVSLGCYSSGNVNIPFNEGLTNTMISQLLGSTNTALVNGFNMFKLSSMTVDTCLSVCSTNSFLFAGLTQ
jgi:hypothetical protein